jgi:alpha-ribazole phosphatase
LVLTSDLCRSTQTLEILSRYTPDLATSQTEPELREQNFGQWENRTYDEIQEQFPEYIEATHHNPASICPPDGESFKDVTTRVTRVIQRYHKTDNIPESSIVCVVHAGTIRAAISHALSLPPEKSLAFHLDHLSVTRIEYFASVDSWKIHYINRTV